MINMYLNVGKMYHDANRDVQQLLVLATAYITYRLSKEIGIKPEVTLSMSPIAKLQASVNKTRRTLRLPYITILQDIRVINRNIRKRVDSKINCYQCGKSILKIDVVIHVDSMFFEVKMCRSCADIADEEEPIQVCPVCKEPYDESYSGCTCEQSD